jgi:mannose-6-phosphate isomerase-like protein (cupin superfamily)
MWKNESNSNCRIIDSTLSIIDLFNGKNFAFDFVIGILDGVHPKLINNVSDRAYYVLSGKGMIDVDDNSYKVKKGDLVLIKAGQSHGLRGKMKYIIVTAPPFNPKNELRV